MKYEGEVKIIGSTKQVTEKFRKREIVLTDNHAKYPQSIMFEFKQDSCDLLDSVSVGDKVEIDFNLNGREYNGKYFNSLNAFGIKIIGQQAFTPPANTNSDLPF